MIRNVYLSLQTFSYRSGLKSENLISCGCSQIVSMLDCCLEPGKIEASKMLDLQTKSAIDSNNLQVQHQATYLALKDQFGAERNYTRYSIEG